MQSGRVIWVSLLILMTTGCGDQSLLRPTIPAPTTTPAPAPTPSPVPLPTRTPATCPIAVGDPLIDYATPPPSVATVFESDPDPANNDVRYSGAVTFAMDKGGIVNFQMIVITNTSAIPLPVQSSDFTITNARLPGKYVRIYEGPSGTLLDGPLPPGYTIAPGATLRHRINVDDTPGELIWRIHSTLNTIVVPIYKSGFSVLPMTMATVCP